MEREGQRPSIRVFKKDWMEKCTHVHPITPLVVWVPIISLLLWHSLMVLQLPIRVSVGLGIIALTVWSLMEYVLHRFVFHFDNDWALVKRLHFIIHGLHHDDPQDATRLVMPPVASLAIGSILFLAFRALLGGAWVEPFFAFFLVGYLCYDYIHYSVNHFTQRTRLGKMLKQSHMTHHYVKPDTRWGVSSPLWDYVFGTLEAPKEVTE